MIGLDPTECERPEFPLVFSGAAPLPGTQPYAQCYGKRRHCIKHTHTHTHTHTRTDTWACQSTSLCTHNHGGEEFLYGAKSMCVCLCVCVCVCVCVCPQVVISLVCGRVSWAMDEPSHLAKC